MKVDVKSMKTVEEVSEARLANRHPWSAPLRIAGTIANERLDARLQAREREILVESLGWKPEGDTYEERYCATTRELLIPLAGAGQ